MVDDINLFKLNGYRHVYNEGRYNRNDGTIVYVRENINFEHENIQLGEITAIDLNIQNNNERIRLTAIYKSPKYVITDFNEKLALYLEDKKHCKKHIITGDINIDLLENEHRVEEYKNILNFFGFTSYINKYTRPESESCLDHFFVKGFQQEESDIKGIVLHNLITDHYPILLSVDLKIKRKNIILKNEKKYTNYLKLKNALSREDWQNLYEIEDVNDGTEYFLNILKNLIETNTTKIRIKNKEKIKKEWITPKILKTINEKQNMYAKLKKNPNNEELKIKYSEMKKQLRKTILRAKQEYFEKCVEDNQNETVALWRYVQNSSKKETQITCIRTKENRVVEDEQEISDIFNDYFSGIGERYANEITEPAEFKEEKIHLQESFFYFPQIQKK